MKSFLFVAALALIGEMAAAAPTHLDHGRFKDLLVYSPPAQASSFVLFLSGDEGWGNRAEGYAAAACAAGRHGGGH